MKLTHSASISEVSKKWILVDAADKPMGRIASAVAFRLRGKHKPTYTPHMDDGDNVIIINAEKVRLTGFKRVMKTHFWHTGFPGGIKSITADKELDGKHPQRLVQRAVDRMIPSTKLGRQQMKNLHVYAGSEHPHAAQKPVQVSFEDLQQKHDLV